MHAIWRDVDRDGFDVVLFSRSLHHMENLDAAVEKAAEVLVCDGLLLVEDFAFHDVGLGTIEWFRSQLQELQRRAGSRISGAGAFASRILEAEDPGEAWHRDADHLHSADQMRSALGALFVVKEEPAPYLYRYLEGLVPERDLADLLRRELGAIDQGVVSPLGRRFAARRRS